MDVTKLTIQGLIVALENGGYISITEKNINDDIKNGAPVNQDGTINIFAYMAWLLNE